MNKVGIVITVKPCYKLDNYDIFSLISMKLMD